NWNCCFSKLLATTFQQRPYERSCFGGTVRVPRLTYFGTIQSLADRQTMKRDRPFCRDELQDLKREFFQACFKVQSCVVNLSERLIGLATQVFDTPDEKPALPTKFAVNRTLRTSRQFDNIIDAHTLIATFEKQV